MAFTEALRLVVDADTRGAVQGIEKLGATADRELGKSEKSMDKWGNRLTSLGTGMIAFGGAALVGLGALAKSSEEANLAQVKLQNTIDNMPKLAGSTAAEFTDLAESIQKVTAANADAIVEAEALLGTFSLTADEIKGITPLVVDYARKFGIDMADAAVQVGKALDGQAGALKRNGVSIDEALFATDRYTAVQRALSDQVGGFAEAEGKTFAGSLERMKNELGDLAEGVGGGAVDAFTTMFGAVERVAGALESVSPGAQNAIGQVATFGAVAVIGAGGLNILAGQAILARQNIAAIGEAVKGLSFAGLATGLAVLAPLTLGAGIALAGYNRTKSEATRITDGYVEALHAETGSTRDAADAYSAAELAAGDFGSALRRSNADIDLLNRAIREQGDVLDELGGKRDVIRDQGFETAMRSAGLETSALTDELERLSGEMSKGEFDRFVARLDALSDGYDKATEQTRNQSFAEGELASQHGDTAAATDDLTDSVSAYKDELNALFDPIFGAVKAQRDLNEANADVTAKEMELAAALAEHGAGSLEAQAATDELTRAQLRAGEATVGQQAALDQLRTSVQSGATSVEDAKNKLNNMAAQGLITAGTAAAVAREFDAIASAQDRIDRNVDINVVTRMTTILAGSTHIPLRAEGGPVLAGHAYVVGEKRPELFVPNEDGMILPAVPGSGSMGAGWGGGGGAVQNVDEHIHVMVDGREIATALRRYDRINGRSWRD